MPPEVLALVGPTAAGKSAIAMAVAERLDAEIVAVDAFTVYRGMDIGTAKPVRAARQRVPHHMIDVLDPWETCTVGWFQQAARSAIDQILMRDRPALLVGGSGLYFRAVVDDLEFPPTDHEARGRVVDRVGADAGVAHAELRRRDPEAADRIDAGNLRRAVRALEVMDLTGRPFSDWRRSWDDYASRYPSLRVVGVDIARDALDLRIASRAREMVAAGLVEEVRSLARGGMSATARAAIGYAEALSQETAADEETLAEAIRLRTRRFAIRQLRWFRSDPRIRWRAPDVAAEELAG
jgi:tRNA dimethylallyltransferase